MEILVFIVGLPLALEALLSAVPTFVLPRSAPDRLT